MTPFTHRPGGVFGPQARLTLLVASYRFYSLTPLQKPRRDLFSAFRMLFSPCLSPSILPRLHFLLRSGFDCDLKLSQRRLSRTRHLCVKSNGPLKCGLNQ